MQGLRQLRGCDSAGASRSRQACASVASVSGRVSRPSPASVLATPAANGALSSRTEASSSNRSSPAARGARLAPRAAAAAPAASSSGVMKTVEVDLGDRSYPIYIGQGLLNQGELLRKHVPGKRVLIVTNTTIAPLYLDR